MKRLIGVLLLAAVVVTMIVVAGAAETEKKIVFTADAEEVEAGDTVTVTKSEYYTKLVHLSNRSFFEIVKNKFR